MDRMEPFAERRRLSNRREAFPRWSTRLEGNRMPGAQGEGFVRANSHPNRACRASFVVATLQLSTCFCRGYIVGTEVAIVIERGRYRATVLCGTLPRPRPSVTHGKRAALGHNWLEFGKAEGFQGVPFLHGTSFLGFAQRRNGSTVNLNRQPERSEAFCFFLRLRGSGHPQRGGWRQSSYFFTPPFKGRTPKTSASVFFYWCPELTF